MTGKVVFYVLISMQQKRDKTYSLKNVTYFDFKPKCKNFLKPANC